VTKDLNITQAQLEQAVLAEESRSLNVGESRKVAPRLWERLRRIETEGLLTAARDSYEKKQWQRAADHYAALDSELGEGAPLPGIWGRNDPYDDLAKSMGTVKVPHPDGGLIVHGTTTGSFGPRAHVWDDITGLGTLQTHLELAHNTGHEGRSATGLCAVHNALHGVDDAGRKLGVSAHEYADFGDEPTLLAAHLKRTHAVDPQDATADTMRHMHRGAHSPGAGVTAPGPHEFKDYGGDAEATHWHLRYAHAWLGNIERPGALREAHRRFHEHELADQAEPARDPDYCGNNEPHESHDYSPGGTTFQTVRFCPGVKPVPAVDAFADPAGVTMDVRGAMSMLVELSRLSPDAVRRALGLLSTDERSRLRGVFGTLEADRA
jgi:hypothetical protein